MTGQALSTDRLDPVLLKLGDYHYKGLTGEAPQMEQAAGFYQAAAESQISAMAHFNLGHMYEHGLGVPQVRSSKSFAPLKSRSRANVCLCRTGTSPSGTTTTRSIQIPMLLCLSTWRSFDSTRARSGRPLPVNLNVRCHSGHQTSRATSLSGRLFSTVSRRA